MSTTEVGVAYVRLLPSMEGFASDVKGELADALTKPARQAGEDAGKELAKGLKDGAGDADLDGITSGIGDKLKLGLAAVGLGAGALLTKGIADAMDLEATTDKLAAQIGTGFAEDAGKVAGDLYKAGFGESVADTADAVRKIYQNGLLPDEFTKDEFENLASQVLTFTDVLEQDMDMTTQSIKSMMESGIAGSAQEAMDVMTVAIQRGADKAGDLAETFQEYSTNFREAGLSAADAAGLMVQGLNAGARDADKVADAIKEFGIRAQDGSKTSADGFKAIGLSAEEMTAKVAKGGPEARDALDQVLDGLRNIEDPAARSQAAVALFGTQAEDLGDALFALDLDTVGNELGDFSGATEGLGSAYDNAASKIESFKRGALMGLTEFVGNTVIPAVEWLVEKLGPPLQSALDAVSPYVTELVDGFTTLKAAFDTGDDFGVGSWSDITGIMANVGQAAHDALESAQPVIDAFKTAWQEIGDFFDQHGEVLTGIIVGLAVAIGGVLVVAIGGLIASMAVAAAPFIAVGVAMAAVGAGIAYLYENVDGFRQFVDETLPVVSDLFQSTFDLISTIVSTTVDAITAAWSMWGDEIMSVTGTVFSLIGSIITNGLSIISGIFKLITALITGDWGAAWDAIKQIVTSNLAIIGAVISSTMAIAKAVVSAAWSTITALFGSQITAIKNTVSNGLNAVVNFFRGLPGSIASAMSTLANAITNPFRSAFNSLKSLWNSTVGGFGFTVPSWIPGVGGKGFTIPKMHTGGIFDAPGGEGLALLQRGEGVFTPDQMRALGSGPGQAVAAPTTVVIDAGNADQALAEWLRRATRVMGGGSVQLAFGQN